MVISLSSNGWRITSKTVRLNSGNSSKNSTPLCAMEISPGCGYCPPPTRAMSEIVWCGERNGRWHIKPLSFIFPTTECIFVVSSASCMVIGGKIEASLLLNIVFPLPGGPIRMILCPPAAAISIERFTDSCPFTSAKSNSGCSKFLLNSNWTSIMVCSSSVFPSKKSMTSVIFSTP